MKTLFALFALAAVTVAAFAEGETNDVPGIVLSNTNAVVSITMQPRQVNFSFPNPDDPNPVCDIVLADVLRVGTNVVSISNERVVTRSWARVTNAIPVMQTARDQLPGVLPLLLAPDPAPTNTPPSEP